jgi:hypothetical protein
MTRIRESASPVIAAALLGAVGIGMAASTQGRGSDAWVLWVPLVVALTAATGALAVYGLRRWAELAALHPIRARAVVGPLAFWAVVAVLAINITGATTHGSVLNGVLLSLATILGCPVAAAMLGIRQVAGLSWQLPRPGERLALLLALRDLLQRLLGVLAVFLVLLTVQAGAFLSLQHDIGTAFGDRPPQYVLVVGAFGSLLIGSFYVPGWSAIRNEAKRLVDDLYPLGIQEEAADVLAAAEARHRLAVLVGAERTLLADVQSDLILLAPLLAAIPALLVA